MLERDGWVFSSRPLSVREEGGRVVVERMRQAVSPAGDLSEESALIGLDVIGAGEFEREASAVGLAPVRRLTVPETPDHIGSTVMVCRR